MFLNFTNRIETTKEEAKKERIVISSKNGMIQGWITEKKFKSLMIPNESPQNEEDEKMKHVMLKDEGRGEFILFKKGGWCRRKSDMKASRCTLGIMRPLVANAKQKQCENCKETFDNKSRLAKHKKYCTKFEVMSVKEQKIRRKTKRGNKQFRRKI